MPIRRSQDQPEDRPDDAVGTLLRDVAQQVELRRERDRIALEVRTADLVAREACVDLLAARIAELEDALARATAPAPTLATVQPATKRRRLGKQLVREGILDQHVVREALKEHRRTGQRLGEVLVARGALTPTALLQALARQDAVAHVSADDRGVALLPAAFALEHRVVALDVPGRPAEPGAMPAAVAVLDLASGAAISELLGQVVQLRLADPAAMGRLLGQAYADGPGPELAPVAKGARAAAAAIAQPVAAAEPVTAVPAPARADAAPADAAPAEVGARADLAPAPIEAAVISNGSAQPSIVVQRHTNGNGKRAVAAGGA